MPATPTVTIRRLAVLATGIVVLAACGSSEGADPLGAEVPVTLATNDSTSEFTPVEPAPTVDPGDGGDPPAGPAATDAVEGTTPAGGGEPAAVVPAEIGGRAFAETLEPESDTASNLLPDLVVDDVRRGTKANIRNIFPADRPVLLWLWAPH